MADGSTRVVRAGQVERPRTAARLLVVAAAYAVAGELARLLAMPPGYASPVWPAAGIALVAVVLWGRPATAGVLLGSFLVNLHIGLAQPGHAVGPVALTAFGIAIGAAAQASIGAWAARRLCGPGNPLERGYRVPIYLLVTGPLACVVNPAWSLLWLWRAGQVAPGHTLATVATWWVGDTIGVLVVAPLLFALSAQWHERRLRPWLNLFGPLLLCLVGVAALFVEASRRAEAEARERFAEHAELVADGLSHGLDRAVAYTESIARAFGAIPELDRDAFRMLVSPWLATSPGVEAFEWLPQVPGDGRAAFEAAARDAAFPDYRIRDLRPDGSLVDAAPRDSYTPVLFVEPLEVEGGAVGYDLASSPERRRALEESRDTGAVVASARVRLVLYPDEWGVVAVAAAYQGVTPPATVAERRAQLRGFATVVIRVDEMVREAQRRASENDVLVRVTDLNAPGAQLMSGPEPGAVREDLAWSMHDEVGGRTWRIDVLSAGPAPRSWAGWQALAAGLAATGMLVAFVLDGRAQTVQVERLVTERTAALARSNEALARSSLELQRFTYVASHDLREPLRTVTAYTELLERDVGPTLDETARGRLRRIVVAARRMQALVTDLVTFARSEARTEPFDEQCLCEAARAALDELAGPVAEAGAHVRLGDMPRARCDRLQMVQVFHHLISNALTFRRPGVPLEIDIEGRRTASGCEVTVRDNGIGIERRDWDRVFEMFQKLDTEGMSPGLGVGLAMCRRIVERHGGRIWVESTPGRGSTFRFTLADRSPT